jgi:hypothetical protein
MTDRTLHVPPGELDALERSMKSVLAELPDGASELRARARVLLEQIRVLKAQRRRGDVAETNGLEPTTATKDWVI